MRHPRLHAWPFDGYDGQGIRHTRPCSVSAPVQSPSNALTSSSHAVIDEADEVLKSDWAEDLEKIFTSSGELLHVFCNTLMLTLETVNFLDESNQIIVCSATFSEASREAAEQIVAEDAWEIHVGRPGSTHANIKQTIVEVEPSEKMMKLHDLIESTGPERTIVFVNTKIQAQKLDDYLFRLCGLPSTLLTSDMTQREREDAL